MWSRLDDQYFFNPKTHRVGVHGRGLHLAGITYSAAGSTDGLIRDTDLTLVAALAEVPSETVDRLVQGGLWVPVRGGWKIHDFLDYNPSAAQLQALKEKRAQAGRKGGQASWKTRNGSAPEPF